MMMAQVERRRSDPGDDILSLLLAARDDEGKPLSNEELHDELVTLLLAGHETTATSLAWALAWLCADAGLLARTTEEVDSAGDDPEATSKLPFLNAVCQEALRILPVFPIVMRVAHSDWNGPLHLPKGDRISPCIYLLHQREDLYPDPGAFRPERFLEGSFGPNEFIPFGGGIRRCIGMAFAQYEMKLVLATTLRTVRLKATGVRPRAVRRNIAMGPDVAAVTIEARR
jgi:cytochrome P450